MRIRPPIFASLLAAVLLVAVTPAERARADEGWDITGFRIVMEVRPDGSIDVVEEIDADFGALSKHGIFREFVVRQPCEDLSPGGSEAAAGFSVVPAFPGTCPSGSDRLYDVEVLGVTANGTATPWKASDEAGLLRVRIGDPEQTVRGPQRYELSYRLGGAMNAFTDHDELYWNVTGVWPVSMADVEIIVRLPEGAQPTVTCYQGYSGFTDECDHAVDGPSASFRASRELYPGEQVTIVAGWQKGVVAVGPPVVEDRVSIDDFFTFDILEFVLSVVVGASGLGFLGVMWWRFGRDRAYTTIHYLTGNPAEHTRPLWARREIVVEFLPPDELRPAQMGVLLDERADTLDVTATIIDLAVRGYLTIEEIPKKGWFGSRDWELKKGAGKAGDVMLPYEKTLWDSLFQDREAVRISKLKNTFYTTVKTVKSGLYKDAVKAGWYRRSPETMRGAWLGVGVGLLVVGGLLTAGAAWLFARPLIFAPMAVCGLLLMLFSHAMPRRTAKGSEALRRVLGFREYVATAETHLHEFNEAQNIFARYLPYAIVFGCVEKWADAFAKIGVNVATQTAGWYSGVHAFNATAFGREMRAFSSGVSSAIASTPGSSGGSGFSGGSSGGGGGGGGGGSW